MSRVDEFLFAMFAVDVRCFFEFHIKLPSMLQMSVRSAEQWKLPSLSMNYDDRQTFCKYPHDVLKL